ncbi:polysaccharide deacetylase family protein [uncultured Dokdonia sp.]|uniref:polysaccharide deacetylase family protein n=1 Tax=uncultured Dokdonia sp. TaxID=575653 RepID=UPI00260FEFF7|nr:polysaccharide deacetylase family protein [uncultured Dokdonia sp.]
MLTVGNYHYIRNDFAAPYPSIFGVTPTFFREQLVALKEIGTFITPQELLENREQVIQSPNHYILITFDDGLKEQYLQAKPILDELEIKALFFINSINFIEKEVTLVHKIHLLRSQMSTPAFFDILKAFDIEGKTVLSKDEKVQAIIHYNYDDEETALLKFTLNFKLSIQEQRDLIGVIFDRHFDTDQVVKGLYMTEAQLIQLANEGMLGSHTHSHLPLGYLDRDVIAKEYMTSKNYLEQLTNKDIPYVSYPYGSREACAAPVEEMAKSAAHTIGFTMERSINRGDENPLLLKRFDCNDLPLGKNQKAFDHAYRLIHK